VRAAALGALLLALAAATPGCAARRERLRAFEEGRKSAYFREQESLAAAGAREGGR